MLDIHQIKARKLKINLEKISLMSVLDEITTIYSFQAIIKRIGFSINLSTHCPKMILIDKYRLLQILINLIGNAFKFTSKGSITLEIKYHFQTDTISFAVIDTGIGIKPEDLSKLFQRFGKLDQGDNINLHGVGLGLLISNELVKALNPSSKEFIHVQSEFGKGSIFSFSVPAGKEADLITDISMKESVDVLDHSDTEVVPITIWQTPRNSRSQKAQKYRLKANEDLFLRIRSIESTTSMDGSQKHCLIVDDNSFNLMAINYLLNKFGVKNDCVLNGQEAIELLEKRSYDVVLMDINMPILNGIEATKIIRSKIKEGKIKDTHIVALTANGEGCVDEYLKIGMEAYLSKPIREEQLKKVLNKFIPNLVLVDYRSDN